MNQKRCPFCRGRFTPLRNPNQRYCSASSCQKKRKNNYKREKLKIDADYQANQSKAQKNWSKQHPDYWKRYRSRNPEYTESNRIAQRNRNTNRHRKDEPNRPVKVIANITLLNHKIQCLSIGYGVILGALEVIAKRERYSQDNPLSVL